MSKFLTYPIWYDKDGNLIEMLSGTARPAGEGLPLTNLAIGQYSEAGTPNQIPSNFGTAVGYHAKAYDYSTALGNEAWATPGIAIGFQAIATDGGVSIGGNVVGTGIGIGGNANGNGIGIGGNANEGKIQLGSSTQTYELTVGNGRMSLNIGSTDQGNWISAKSNGISQGLYLVRYGAGQYINTVYLMAPIEVTVSTEGHNITNDWYFPFNISPFRVSTGSANPVVAGSYYLKVDKTSSASALSITPVYYNKNTSAFVTMSDGASVMLFKIL